MLKEMLKPNFFAIGEKRKLSEIYIRYYEVIFFVI